MAISTDCDTNSRTTPWRTRLTLAAVGDVVANPLVADAGQRPRQVRPHATDHHRVG